MFVGVFVGVNVGVKKRQKMGVPRLVCPRRVGLLRYRLANSPSVQPRFASPNGFTTSIPNED